MFTMKYQSSTAMTFFLLLLAIPPFVYSDLNSDRQALLDFSSSVPHGRKLNWDLKLPICMSWAGVTCNAEKTRVVAVRLPGIGLMGPIPHGTIGKLDALEVLSLRSNSLEGDIPSDVSSLPSLRSLFLQHNNLSGSIPDAFSPTLFLIDLSSNAFTGNIPSSLNNLSRLAVLYLQNNRLSGGITGLNPPKLKLMDLSNNKLDGVIPNSLQRFPKSSFMGNPLCGTPMGGCDVIAPSPTTSTEDDNATSSKELSRSAMIGIIIGCASALFIIIIIILVCCLRKIRSVQHDVDELAKDVSTKKSKNKNQMPKEDFGSGVQTSEKNKLVFFEGCSYNFDLEDLLRASAEVLGKGSYGTAYKAILDEGVVVVVKRLKEVGIGKRDFEQHMELVSKVGQHSNVVPLRAYYFSKDEKLLVYDFISGGSLSAILHGNGYSGKTPLDWNSRITIAQGAARGILHIHTEAGGKFIHGNIKSSNILLSNDHDACVSDFGLPLLMNFQGINTRSIGYHAPEVVESRKATQKSDVYSFGVLLLEMLTGKAPIKTSHGQNDVLDLPRWVHSVVREEWTSEVFDAELLRNPSAEEEMVQMLQIALACVARVPDMRPDIGEVVRMIEEIRPVDSDENRSKGSNACTPTP